MARRPDLLGLGGAEGGEAGGGLGGAAGSAAIVTVREAQPGDMSAVETLLFEAFEREEERDAVRALRRSGELLSMWVAVQAKRVVGVAVLTELMLDGQGAVRGLMGLGPVAVASSSRRRGIGTALVEASLGRAKRLGGKACFVAGSGRYFAALGFEPAEPRFTSALAGSEDWRVHTLRPLAETVCGMVRHPDAFGGEA